MQKNYTGLKFVARSTKILIIFDVTFLMQWSSMPLYHFWSAYWEISTCLMTPWCKLFLVFLFLPLLFHYH